MSVREKVIERFSHVLRHEVENDFRENLFSIFVDNLNPKVDLVCLWEFFKSFGKVRDVFLSSKNSSRRCCFAFVRFESMEEAERVAKEASGRKKAEIKNPCSRSFVEVAKGFEYEIQEEGDEGNKKLLYVLWDSNLGDKGWLLKCGVLKDFVNVYSVNHRLSSRGFSFSSSYLGDKSIVWCFDSEDQREAFI
ncbi:hypothetical protein Dsin_008624 [Dipteronia sinensis]|uniref:RRM domain-containing protein n=1 Tax=Dipteronia sinensis TaxID=43782 RepID=A0AAE0AQ49_9ROSI|nr:hypothetical protein Dsin_008624 [Dipteronia sinensis]